jgi:HK97 family phage prohead protease
MGPNHQEGSVDPEKTIAFETKRLVEPFTVEELAESDGTFKGKGIVFNVEHQSSSWMLGPEWKDRVLPGAFQDTLEAHAKAGTLPLMLYMHERGNIPGVWTEVKELKSALAVRGQVSKAAVTPSGVPLLELMRMKAITGLSIGFRPTEVKLDEQRKIRDILRVDLREISIVDEPGNGPARITDVKRSDPSFLEKVLREAGLSRNEAKAIIAKGLGALREAAADDDPSLREAGGDGGSSEPQLRGLIELIRSRPTLK